MRKRDLEMNLEEKGGQRRRKKQDEEEKENVEGVCHVEVG